MCYLLIEAVILLVLTSRSPLLRLACVFLVSCVTRCVKRFSSSKKKRKKFATLREDILLSPFVSLKTLQRFSGKAISFSLAIPDPNCMYARFLRLFHAIRVPLDQPTVKLEANLRAEIEY